MAAAHAEVAAARAALCELAQVHSPSGAPSSLGTAFLSDAALVLRAVHVRLLLTDGTGTYELAPPGAAEGVPPGARGKGR